MYNAFHLMKFSPHEFYLHPPGYPTSVEGLVTLHRFDGWTAYGFDYKDTLLIGKNPEIYYTNSSSRMIHVSLYDKNNKAHNFYFAERENQFGKMPACSWYQSGHLIWFKRNETPTTYATKEQENSKLEATERFNITPMFTQQFNVTPKLIIS